MGPTNFFSSLTLGNESINRPEKEDYVEIWKILNTDILDKCQKKWVSYFINKVGKMPMNEVLIKDKKIEISFVNAADLNRILEIFNIKE